MWLTLLFLGLNAIPQEKFRETACNLKSGTFPRVILIGENHDDDGSKKIRTELSKGAADGKFPFGGEVAEFPDFGVAAYKPHQKRLFDQGRPDSLAHGIESEMAWGVTRSYVNQINNIRGRIAPEITTLNLIECSADTAPLTASMDAMFEKAKTVPRYKKIAKLIEAAKELSEDQEFIESKNHQTRFKQKIGDHFSAEQLREFATLHHTEVINLINSKFLRYYDGQSLPILANELDIVLVGCRGSPCTPSGRLRDIIIHQRDRDFAFGIADLLCHYKGQYSDLPVLTGFDHSPGVRKWLEDLSDKNIKLVELRSDIPTQAELVRDAIKGIRKIEKPGPVTTENLPSTK